MKRLLVVILVIVAVGIYSYNAFLLLRPSVEIKSGKKSKKHQEQSIESLIARAAPVRFTASDRNPFLPRPEKKNEQKTVQGTALKPPKPTVAAPSISISGIMWDEQSPLAMITLPDGSSAAVKAGQTVGDITIKKIEKERICIVFQNTTFWITR